MNQLRVEEVIGARPNNSATCSPILSVASARNEIRIVFISGRNAFVYDSNFKLNYNISCSQLGDGEILEACAIQHETDMIALSSGSNILFYYPQSTKQGLVWEFANATSHPCQIRSLDWGSNAELLIGGRTMSIMHRKSLSVEMTTIFSIELPFDTQKCVFSPCAKFFAILGMDQSRLMIWYKRMRIDKMIYDYVLLPHPDAVTDFSWRDIDPERSLKAALMTQCKDEVARFWSQNETRYGFQSFAHAGAIDSSGYIFGNQSPTRGLKEKKSAMHWLTGKGLTAALLQQRDLIDFKESLHEKDEHKLYDTLHEFPDMVYQVSACGTMSIWGIQGLGADHHRVTKINLIIRTESTVSKNDASFFDGFVKSVFVKPRYGVTVAPEIVLLACRASDQVMNAYKMNLNDFFTNDWNSPRLTLKHSFCGPRSPIKRMKRHPVLSLLAALEESGVFSIYDTSAAETLRLPNSTGIQISSVLPEGCACVEFEWLRISSITPLLLLSDLKHVYIYDARLSCCAMLQESDSIEFMFVYSGDSCASSVVIGIDSSSQVTIWHLQMTESGEISQQVLATHSSLLLGRGLYQPASFTFGDTIRFSDYPAILNEFDPISKSISSWHWKKLDEPVSIPGLNEQSLVKVWTKVLPDEVETVYMLKAASFGKVAVAFSSKGYNYIDIWDNEYSGLEICLESRLSFDSQRIVSMDWQTTYDGQHLLAVATSSTITIFSKSHFKADTLWVSIGSFKETEAGLAIKSISWISYGHIFLSTTIICKIISPWFLEAKDSSLLEISSMQSSRLPDYDSTLLSYYVIWGKSDLVRYNLSLLHRFLKLSIDSGRECIHIPIPLWKLLEEKADCSSKTVAYDDLFENSGSTSDSELGIFNQEHVTYLVENLSKSGLPNKNSLVAFIKAFHQLEQHQKSLDENGLRFFLNASYHIYIGDNSSLSAKDFTWAFFSESQDYLLEILTQSFGGTMYWKDAKRMGLGYWITNQNTLKQCFETVARNQYWGADGVHDPVACSLFYFALKKKNVLLGLWKLANTHPEQAVMLKFLANDFDEHRWKTAALKNAFALLGKQRYEYAAAFFLLAGKLKDAANVCLKQLDDPQLAICICRVYEGSECGAVLSEILTKSLLQMACQTGDRWLSAILWTMAGRRDNAFYSIARHLNELLPSDQSSNLTPAAPMNDPNLFILLSHLKIAYKKLIMSTIPSLTSLEEGLFRTECVKAFDQLGCPGSALQMILDYKMDQLPDLNISLPDCTVQVGTVNRIDQREDPAPSTSGLDWGELEAPKQKSSGLDWGELETPKQKSGGLDWGELETTSNDVGLNWGELEPSQKLDELTGEGSGGSDSSPVKVTEGDAFRIRVHHIDVKAYKKLLVLRILHDLHNSSMAVVTFKKELENDSVLSEYFENVQKGLRTLSLASGLSLTEIGKLIASRSFEMHVLDAFVELVPFGEDAALSTFVDNTESMFFKHTKFLVSKCFKEDQPGKEDIDYAANMSKNLLKIWTSWQKKVANQSLVSSEFTFNAVLVSSFIIQVYVSIVQGNTGRLWWLMGLCEQFFDFLLKGNLKGLVHLLDDLLSDHPPIAHPEDESILGSDAKVDLYDEFGIALYQKESHEANTAEKFIHCVLLCHILSSLRTFLDRLAERMNINDYMDSTFIFLSENLEKRLVDYAYRLELHVAESWRKRGMDLKKIPAYIMELDLNDLWSLIKRTADTKATASAILRLKKTSTEVDDQDIAADSKKELEESFYSTLIVTSQIPILSFVINPLDTSQIAYITSTAINEIDVSVSKQYYSTNSNPREIGSRENVAVPYPAPAKSPRRGSLLGREMINIKKKLSFDSVAKLVKRPFNTTHLNDSALADKGLRMSRPVNAGTALECHKSLNYFLAGSGDNSTSDISVSLYQFGQTEPLVEYSAESEGRITKCHFDPYGAKFGGADSRGNLNIWKFDSSAGSITPSIVLTNCHEGAVNDFTFVNSSSIIATAGMSSSNMNISIWDTLLPPQKSRVQSFLIGEAGISTVVYSSKYHLLIAGVVMDVRQSVSLINSFEAHDHLVKSVAIDSESGSLISGSVKGDIKLWDINAIAIDNPPSRAFNPWPYDYDQSQTLGVTELQTSSGGEIYNLWGNGCLFASRFQ